MIYIVDLEPVESRYTAQWKEHVPALFKKAGYNVQIISGPLDIPSATTPGAFLNFGGTNVYKANQVEQLGRLFCSGTIKSGDHFLFTDAWHPGIINLKYMSSLLGVDVTIHALWHAGSYDPADFLGRLIGDAPWVRHSEKAFFAAIDHNYFATDFHINMFLDNLLSTDPDDGRTRYGNKIIKTGWPMEYMQATLRPFKGMPKKDMIVFPHRIAPEKQVDIFKDLAAELPQYEFVICQEKQLTKDEYHKILGEAKLVFSANLQETLGISPYEGAELDAIPMVPDRLSYTEMYLPVFKYPSEWTIDWNAYVANKNKVISTIKDHMDLYSARLPAIQKQTEILREQFFSAKGIIDNFF